MTAMTVEEILERNPTVTREQVEARAALTPDMLARIAASRDGFFGSLVDETDRETALSLVAGDLAMERDEAAEAERCRALGLVKGQRVLLNGHGWHHDDVEGDAHMDVGAGRVWIVRDVHRAAQHPHALVVLLDPAEAPGHYTIVWPHQISATAHPEG